MNSLSNERSSVAHLCIFLAMCLQMCVFQPLMGREIWKGHQTVALWANILCWKGLMSGGGEGRGGWAVLCCQATVQMTASREAGTHSFEHTVWTALLRGFPEYNCHKIDFSVLFLSFCLCRKVPFSINDQPAWCEACRITQPRFSCLMSYLCVCLACASVKH